MIKINDYFNFSCPQCVGRAPKVKGKNAPEVIDLKNVNKFINSLQKTARFTIRSRFLFSFKF